MNAEFLEFLPESQKDSIAPCPKCKGRKMIKSPYFWKDFEEALEQCPRCNGIGWVIKEEYKQT